MPAEEQDGARDKQNKKALKIVERNAMSIFVLQSELQFFLRKRAKHGLRDDQAWTEDPG